MSAPVPGRDTFDRVELDAAEPARPPSARRAWSYGLVLGLVAVSLGIVVLPILVATGARRGWSLMIPPAAAGTLVGAGVTSAIMLGLMWAGWDAATEIDWPLVPYVGLAIVGVALLPVGLLATVAAIWRER